MALTSCMWTGVSGLLAHGEKMNVIGNNIANVSTVGFRGQRMDFADFVYQNTFTSNGLSQIGRGVKVGAIMQNFTAGSYESTTEATDLSINGRGFFKVNKIGEEQAYYTRAGNLRFNNDGYLVDPNGLALQGWKVDNNGGVQQAAGGMKLDAVSESKKSDIIGSGVPQDIKLDSWTVYPQQTTNIVFKVNLPNDGPDKATSQTNPFTALLENWDGTQPPPSANTKPMPESAYEYATTMQVYDEAGSKHNITIYYDKVDSTSYAGGNSTEEIWEYTVTMDPSEDQRVFFDTVNNTLKPISETKMAGVLMAGTMTFNKAGGLINQSAYTWGGNRDPLTNPLSFQEIPDPGDPLNTLQVINMDPENLNNWYPAAISTSGLPITVANFSGVLDAQTSGSPGGAKYNIEMDFGLKIGNYAMPWENQVSLGQLSVEPYAYNSSYQVNDPSRGPEFIRLNPNYDPTLDPRTDGPNALQYLIEFATYPDLANAPNFYPTMATMTAAEVTAYHVALAQLKGVGNTTVPADTNIGGVKTSGDMQFTVDTSTLDANGQMDAGTLITVVQGATTYGPDTAANMVGLVPGLTSAAPPIGTVTDANLLTYLNTTLDAQWNSPTMVDRSMLAAASASNANNVAEMSKPVIIDAQACTSFNGKFSASQAQDGYGYGDLSSWMVDQEGVLYGVYSNGVTLPLWQVTLYDFTAPQGLRREGNNLFSQTRYSGESKSGPAGVAGLGSINGYSLEGSNVDMSTEFVQMITTQRGFQANSKVVTTTDTMLDTVINMKR